MTTNSQAKQLTNSLNLSGIISSRIFWILSFSILTFLSAQVEVPVQPVPFTLQTMIVLLSGAFLGPVNGAISQLLYIAAGALGLPVFAGFGFGLATLLGPTGGYLAAFPLAAFLVGFLIEKNKSSVMVFISMLIGTASILFSGALYLSLFVNGDFQTAFNSGVLIFAWWGLLKTAASASIFISLKNKYPTLPNREA